MTRIEDQKPADKGVRGESPPLDQDASAAPAVSRSLSPARRFVFTLVVALFVLAAIEATSFLLLWSSAGQLPSSKWMATALELASAADGGVDEQAILERGESTAVDPSNAKDSKADDNAPSAEVDEEPAGAVERFVRDTRKTNALHPYLGFVMDADHPLTIGGPFAEEGALWGFPRNRHNIFYEPSEDRVVVAVFGGSVAEIFVATAGEVLAEELERSGIFGNAEVVVVGFGLGGFKQPQQLMALNYFLAMGAHFDVVINIDGFNEVALPVSENLKANVFPFYPRGWQFRVDGLDLQERRVFGELTFLQQRRAQAARGLNRSVWRRSRTVALLWWLRDQRQTFRLDALERTLAMGEGDATVPRGMNSRANRTAFEKARTYQASGPPRQYDSLPAMFADLAALWERTSVQMKRLSEAYEIEYFHFLQPNQYLPDSKPMGEEELAKAFLDRSVFRNPVRRGYPNLFSRVPDLLSQGVQFHDLTQVFAEVEEPLYIDTCCHFDRKGNRIMAGVMAGHIVADLRAKAIAGTR